MKKRPSEVLLSVAIIGVMSLFLAISCTPNNESKIEVVISSTFPVHNIDYNDSDQIQSSFDNEMWQTFLALCWPADGLNPVADEQQKITDNHDDRAVFENYSFNYDIFLLNLRDTTKFKPVSWGNPNSLDAQRRARWKRWSERGNLCPDLVADAEAKGITNMAAILPLDEFIQASNKPSPHVPVIDLNKNFIWSGVVFNEITFDFVVGNQLYDSTGITLARKNVKKESVHQVYSVHEGSKSVFKDTIYDQMVNRLEENYGSMHLKTSWKILEPGEDTTNIHTAWAATLFNNINFDNSTQIEPNCSLVKVGLVGMHIAFKTEDQPNGIWATFEHVDNCPEKLKAKDQDYTIYDYKERASYPNIEPEANEEVDDTSYRSPKWFNPDKTIPPSQIAREVPISAATKAMNKAYQQQLKNTVWSNYQLVGTQWTIPSNGKFTPELLSNATLETFDQTGSSCIGCHHQVTPNTLKGGINDGQFTMTDFPTGNVLNLNLELKQFPDTAVYSDYMWSLLKWQEDGHLTWKQIKN